MDPAFFCTVIEEEEKVNPANEGEGREMEASDEAFLKNETVVDPAFISTVIEEVEIVNNPAKEEEDLEMEDFDVAFCKSGTKLDPAFFITKKIEEVDLVNSTTEEEDLEMDAFDVAFVQSGTKQTNEGSKMKIFDASSWKSGGRTMLDPGFFSTTIIEEGEIVNFANDGSKVETLGDLLKSGTKLDSAFFSTRVIEEGEIVELDDEDLVMEAFDAAFCKSGSGTALNTGFELPSKELLRALKLECDADDSSSEKSGKSANPFTPDWFALAFEIKNDGRITLPSKPKLTDEANSFSIKAQHEFIISLPLTPRPAVDHLGRPISKDDNQPMSETNKRPQVEKDSMFTVTKATKESPQFTKKIQVNKYPIRYKRKPTISSSQQIIRLKVSGNKVISTPKKPRKSSKIKPRGTFIGVLSPD